MINAFVQLLLTVGQVQSDVIGELPTEVSANIFRYLDEESLVSAASVNRRWKSICKGDPILRRKIRKTLRKQKQARIQAYFNPSAGQEVTRNNPARMFGRRNDTVSVRTKSVKYEIPTISKETQMKMFKVRKTDNKVHPTSSTTKRKSDKTSFSSTKKILRL